MPSSANDNSILPFLKRQYPKGISWTGYKKSKLLQLIGKDTTFGGEGKHYTVSTAPTQGGSSDYQKAYSHQGPTKSERFFLQHRTEYQLARIKGSAIAKTMGEKNAIKSVITEEFDKAGYNFGREMCAILWAAGGGARGRIKVGTSLTGAVITLATKTDIVRFEVGMWVQFSSDDGTGTSPSGLRGGGTELQVTKVSPSGTVTLSANLNTVPLIADTDFIFRSGDYGNRMTGVPGWVPITAPTVGDNFFGVNRSNHEFRLAGYRRASVGGSKEAAILDCAAEASTFGTEGTYVCTNSLDYNDLVKELGSDRIVDVESDKGKMGFKAIEIESAMGTLKILAEPDVPKGFFWILDPDDIELATAGDCPRVLDFDGLGKLVRVQGEDAYQFDIGAYGNIGHKNPGNAAVGAY